MTGREPNWNVDMILDNPDVNVNQDPHTYAWQVYERMMKVNDVVRAQLQINAGNYSRWFNKRVQPADFTPGTSVYIYSPRRYRGRSPKWQSCYKTQGTVIKKLNDVTYIIRSTAWREPRIVHVDKLKRII
jgi:hypothetical protein